MAEMLSNTKEAASLPLRLHTMHNTICHTQAMSELAQVVSMH
jgi:hypothetical protein